MLQTTKLKMTHSTPKIDLILLKLGPIPLFTHGASFTIDTFVIGSLPVMPQSDCLPVPAQTAKPNDGK